MDIVLFLRYLIGNTSYSISSINASTKDATYHNDCRSYFWILCNSKMNTLHTNQPDYKPGDITNQA